MKKWSILLLLLMIAVLAIGCGRSWETSDPINSSATKPPSIHSSVPTSAPLFESVMFSRTEPYPYTKFYGGVNGKSYVSDKITYHFEATIPDDRCIEAMQRMENAFQRIEDITGASDDQCNVYIFSNEYAPRTFEHQFYAGIENPESQDMLICLIQAYYGFDLNYGLAYALSCEVADTMGIPYDSEPLPLTDALALAQWEPAFCDMNYACFSPFYAEEQQIQQVKSLSRHFYSQLQAEDRYDLFREFTEEKYCAYLSSFLADHGLPSYDNSDLAGTVFYDGGLQTRMAWKNHIGEFYVENDYTVTYHDNIFPDDMTNSGYTNLRRIIVDYIAQAEYANSKLSAYKVNDAPLYVLFMKDKYNSSRSGAVYLTEKNEIRMFAASAFLHEYTHYLTEWYISGWRCELLPNYYTNDTVSEHINYVWYSDVLTYSSLDPNNPDDALKYELFQGVKANLGHTFDWTSREDFQYLLDAYIIKRGWLDRITEVDGGVATKTSYFHFLVNTKDEQTATAAMLEDAPEMYFGYSWYELIELWKQDLRTRFEWVNS